MGVAIDRVLRDVMGKWSDGRPTRSNGWSDTGPMLYQWLGGGPMKVRHYPAGWELVRCSFDRSDGWG